MDAPINSFTQLGPLDLQIPPPDTSEKFERLCLDLYKKEYGQYIQKNGRSGQSQNGVDIFVSDKHIGIQCKKKQYTDGSITEQELKSEVEKAKIFQPNLKKFILATTCKRDANIQKIARIISHNHTKKNLFSVEIHSWQEIKELLEKHQVVYEKYYKKSLSNHVNNQPKNYLSQSHNLSQSVKMDNNSYHTELNRIRDLIHQQPLSAFKLLEKFKQDEWPKLNKINKFRVIANMGCAKINMNQLQEGASLLMQALQFNKEDENALINYAVACLINNNLDSAKKYTKKIKNLNPLNISAHIIDIKIKNKEGISLDKIIKNLPNSLKTNYKVANTLFDISLDKQKYQEANKWYKIFQENKSNNTEDNLISASMSLRKILEENHDISYFRIVPDKLSLEIKKIVNIYHSVISNNECKHYDPNLYINYAIANELNGESDKAINILQKIKNEFQDNTDVKNELIRLLMCKSYTKEIIKVIEDTPEEKRSVLMYIILSNIKYQEGKLEEGIKILKKASQLSNINNIDKDIIQKTLISYFIELNKLEEAKKELDIFCQSNPKNPFIYIFKSQIAGKEKNKNHQLSYLKEACSLIKDNDKNYDFLLLLVNELTKHKMYKQCEPLLEKITNNNLNCPKIFDLLKVYFESGNNEQALALAKKLTDKFPHQIEPFNYLFRIYESLGDRLKAIKCYEKYFKLNPTDTLAKINLMQAYFYNEQLTKAKNILETMLNNDLLSDLHPNYINLLTPICSKLGYWKEAVEIQYKSIKNYPQNPELQNVYMFLFFNKDTKDATIIGKLNIISIDCYVKIKELQSHEKKEIIIENNADIYKPNHELSKKLLGKNIKDIITLNNKKYKIIDIKSKYLHKHYEISKNIEINFPSKSAVKLVHVPKPLSVEKLTKSLKTVMPKTSQGMDLLNKVFTEYQQGKMTIGAISHITNKHPIEVMELLIQSKKFKFLSSIAGTENNNILYDNLNIIIDLSSLMIIHRIKISEYLEKSPFNLYVCQSTIDSLNEVIQKNKLHAQDGLTTIYLDQNDKLAKQHTSADDIKRFLIFLDNIQKWCKKNCKIKSIPSSLKINREIKLTMDTYFGTDFLNPFLASYDQKDTLVLCEDAILSVYMQSEFNVLRVRLLDVIEYLHKQYIIDDSQAIQFKAQLVSLNQSYISIDHKILFYLLKESSYSINHIHFQRGLFFLTVESKSKLESVIVVLANFLIELFQEAGVLNYHKRMITQEVLNKACSNRNESSKYIVNRLMILVESKTYLLPLLQKDIRKAMNEWYKNNLYTF